MTPREKALQAAVEASAGRCSEINLAIGKAILDGRFLDMIKLMKQLKEEGTRGVTAAVELDKYRARQKLS